MAVRHKGKVERLYLSNVLYIRLKGLGVVPANNYFTLRTDHSQFNNLYALALTAAINGYELDIRTTEEVDPDQEAIVQYMVIDW